MEIKVIDDVKKEIGNRVKFSKPDNLSENLQSLDVLEGVITKVISNWEHTVNGDVCKTWAVYIDVVDPNDGGLHHHVSCDRIFSLDEKNADIVNIDTINEIAELQGRIAVLEASKIELSELIKEE